MNTVSFCEYLALQLKQAAISKSATEVLCVDSVHFNTWSRRARGRLAVDACDSSMLLKSEAHDTLKSASHIFGLISKTAGILSDTVYARSLMFFLLCLALGLQLARV